MFNRIAIIGLGLIGSSLAQDMFSRHLARQIVGFDNNPLAGEALRVHGFIHEFHTKIAEVSEPVDLVIISTPPRFFDEVARKLSPLLKEGTLVMDTGSIKQSIIATVSPHIPATALFIPAHPITGSEKSGVGAGEKDLFVNRRVILTPEENAVPAALDLAIHVWEALGAHCEIMSAEKHDLIYAYMSHLPHLVAYAASGTVAAYGKNPDRALRNFLRIGGSSPELWCDIALANESHLSAALEYYLTVLNHVIAELKTGETLGEASEGKTQEIVEQLLPRIAASCLISAITLCEKRDALSLARYGGQGFMDITSPLQAPPDADIERISKAWKHVATVLGDFEERLRALAVALKEHKHEALLALMQQAQKDWRKSTG